MEDRLNKTVKIDGTQKNIKRKMRKHFRRPAYYKRFLTAEKGGKENAD